MSNKSETEPTSKVADMTIILKSLLKISAICKLSARPKSELIDRSWNSSKIIQPTSDKLGLDCIIRISMPSVMTTIRVCLLTLVSPLILKPTVSPILSLSIAAI